MIKILTYTGKFSSQDYRILYTVNMKHESRGHNLEQSSFFDNVQEIKKEVLSGQHLSWGDFIDEDL